MTKPTTFSLHAHLTQVSSDTTSYGVTDLIKTLIGISGNHVYDVQHHKMSYYQQISRARTLYQKINDLITRVDKLQDTDDLLTDFTTYNKAIDALEEYVID